MLRKSPLVPLDPGPPMATEIGLWTHVPFSQMSWVLGSPSSVHGCFSFAGSVTQVVPSHFLHSGQLAVAPVVAGLPPQCHPPLMMPTPGSEWMTVPSSLTEPVPMETN